MVDTAGFEPDFGLAKGACSQTTLQAHKIGSHGGTRTHNPFLAAVSKTATYAFRHAAMVAEVGFEPTIVRL